MINRLSGGRTWRAPKDAFYESRIPSHDQLLEPLIERLRWQNGNWGGMCSLNDAEDDYDSPMVNLTLNQTLSWLRGRRKRDSRKNVSPRRERDDKVLGIMDACGAF